MSEIKRTPADDFYIKHRCEEGYFDDALIVGLNCCAKGILHSKRVLCYPDEIDFAKKFLTDWANELLSGNEEA